MCKLWSLHILKSVLVGRIRCTECISFPSFSLLSYARYKFGISNLCCHPHHLHCFLFSFSFYFHQFFLIQNLMDSLNLSLILSFGIPFPYFSLMRPPFKIYHNQFDNFYSSHFLHLNFNSSFHHIYFKTRNSFICCINYSVMI